MMIAPDSDILPILFESYGRAEFPALLHQVEEWKYTKPLKGLDILDSTPLFLNTFAKYAALIEAGASLTIGISETIPPSEEAAALARRLGIPMITAHSPCREFDLILDCAGAFRSTPSRLGYVELTRSGILAYEGVKSPVWAVDSGAIKQIETTLGTGDGFFRAMRQLGHSDWKNKKLIVFGYGKVGKGIVLKALLEGADVTVVDIADKKAGLPPEAGFIPLSERRMVDKAVREAFCAVTATGIIHALEGVLTAEEIASSPVLLANMGVEDEWGEQIPSDRVLNHKKALNFILKDPTRMCYIDPAMALHNAGAVELATKNYPQGISVPPPEIEAEYIRLIRQQGIILEEMNLIGLE